MKQFILALSLIATSSLFGATDPVNPVTKDTPHRGSTKLMIQGELSMLDSLIGVTESNLKNQKQLRAEIQDYQTLQGEYLKDTENTELLFRVAKSASRIYSNIEESHLGHTFSPEFLKELKLFAQVAKKRGIPRSR